MLNAECVEKIKSRWLMAFYIFFGVTGLKLVVELAKRLVNGNYKDAGLMTIDILVTAGWAYLTYYFAYQKGGTNWLTMVIFLQLLTIGTFVMFSIAELVKVSLGLATNFEAVYQPLMIFVYLPVLIYYLYNNYKLLNLNDELKQSQVQDVSDVPVENSQNLPK